MRRWAHAHGCGLVAVETFLEPGGALCDEFDYVAVVREPVSRLVSRVALWLGEERENFVRASLEGSSWRSPRDAPPGVVVDASAFSGFKELSGTASLNNPMIRALLGKEVYKLPLDAVNASHLEQAKRLLDGFALTVPLEHLSDAALPPYFAARFGWTPPSDADGGLTKTNAHSANRSLSTEAMRLLRTKNALDRELYEHARVLFTAQLAAVSPPLRLGGERDEVHAAALAPGSMGALALALLVGIGAGTAAKLGARTLRWVGSGRLLSPNGGFGLL